MLRRRRDKFIPLRARSTADIVRQFTVAYYSQDNPHGVLPHTTFRAAVVFDQDPALLAAEAIRDAQQRYGKFDRWMLFTFEGPLRNAAGLADGWEAHDGELEARAAGRAWVGTDGVDWPLDQLPDQVLPTLIARIRHFPDLVP